MIRKNGRCETAKLNLGSGSRRISGFVNVDKSLSCKPDIAADLDRTPWPFRDNIADEILMSHVIEHLVALYLGVDFEVVRVSYTLDEPRRTLHRKGEMDDETINRAALTQNNIVKQLEVELLVHKPE